MGISVSLSDSGSFFDGLVFVLLLITVSALAWLNLPQELRNPVTIATGIERHKATIIYIILGVLGTFGITAREIFFLSEPILEPPPVDETAMFMQPFTIRNGMSFFTMHETCVVAFIEGELYDQSILVGSHYIVGKLRDIGPGKVNYLETARSFGFRGPSPKPIYGSLRFFVRYYMNILGAHWTRDFDVGTCQWKSEAKVTWECPESANAQKIRLAIPILKFDHASGKVVVQSQSETDAQVKKVIERELECNY
jgi:hypothetical protein